MRFDGQSVLVTGASRGIGRAVATAFAVEGARVTVHCNTGLTAAREVLDGLAGSGHLLVQADMGDAGAVRAMVDHVATEQGGLDVLVNNAGIYLHAPPDASDAEQWLSAWRRTMAVNAEGPAVACHAAARHMITAGGGRIVNISSRGAFRGEPDAPAYAASKGALNSLTQSLAKKLGPLGVLLYAVAPGWVETDMAAAHLLGAPGEAKRAESPLGRVARPEDIAATVLFLASREAEFLTGDIIDVNGASYFRM